MKNFRVQIRYHGYYADFNVSCKDTAIDIENSILDKLGKNEVKFEKDTASAGLTGEVSSDHQVRNK